MEREQTMSTDHLDRERETRRRRLIETIEFGAPDRLAIRGECGSEAALRAVTGRSDYADHPKEVYAEANRIWDVDLIHQFVLPDRLDRSVGPGAECDVSALRSSVHALISRWGHDHGGWQSPEAFRDFCLSLPGPEAAARQVDRANVAEQWIALDRWGDFLKPMVWIPGHLAGTVNWMHYTSVGYENYLIAHHLYPEALDRLFAYAGAEARSRNEAIARAIREHDIMPLIYSGEDICGNDGPLCSPAVLREVYFPHLKRAIEPIVEAGIHWMWHSDGDILPILDDLIACGIDGFQGFEEDKGMDLDALLGKTCANGKPPFICGSVSVTTTMYRDVEAVVADCDRLRRIQEVRGGVILGSSSSIMPDTPVENVLALYDPARRELGP